jgi:hypothetical protein
MVDVGDDGDVAKFHERASLAADVRRRERRGYDPFELGGDGNATVRLTALSRLIVQCNTRKVGEREGQLAVAYERTRMAGWPSRHGHLWILQFSASTALT